MTLKYSQSHCGPSLGSGVYTIPDAASILSLSSSKFRRWLKGYSVGSGENERSISGLVREGTWGEGLESGLNFLAMIEIYVFGQLRDHGVSAQKLRKCHKDLCLRLGSPHPFASCKLLSRDGKVFVDMGRELLLELDAQGQTALKDILEPFCRKIEFDEESSEAVAFWPMGKGHDILVDPKHAFGQPRIKGTNILAETVAGMVLGGESPERVSELYDIPVSSVRDSVEFITQAA